VDQRLVDNPAGRVTAAAPEIRGRVCATCSAGTFCRIERTLSEPEAGRPARAGTLQHADGVQPEQLSRSLHGCAGTSECPLDGNCSGVGYPASLTRVVK